MELTIKKNGILEINDARLIYTNFLGEVSQYNKSGERNFSLVIPTMEMANALLQDKNEDGAAWNVKIKPPRREGEEPFITLPVKIKFNNFGPNVYLVSGKARVRLNEETIGQLSEIEFERVDMDIRPYDNITNGKAYRTAYLSSMEVTQRLDRFEERYSRQEDFAD